MASESRADTPKASDPNPAERLQGSDAKATDTEIDMLRAKVDRLEKQQREATERADRRSDEASRYLQQLDEQRHQLKHCEHSLTLSGNELHDLRDMYEKREQEMTRIGQRARAQEQQIVALQQKLEALASEKERNSALLETRTSELRAAQVYLTKSDVYSDADICQMVETLNADIFQCVAMLADTFSDMPKDNSICKRVDVGMQERVENTIGAGLTQALIARTCEMDPMLLQVSLQSGLAVLVQKVVASWDMGQFRGDGLLSRIYDRLQHTVPQAVAARWRSLTRASILDLLGASGEITSAVVGLITEIIVDILSICGIVVEETHELVLQRYKERLDGIAEKILTLRSVIGVDVIACELDLTYVPGAEPFCSRRMEDAFGKRSAAASRQQTKVLCTTELGLWRVEKTGRDQRSTLLKPKVLLDDFLMELISDTMHP